MRRLSFAVVVVLTWSLSAPARAHEVRPGYLQITETIDRGYEVLWKRPIMGEVAVHLVPHLSGGWLDNKPAAIEVSSSFAIETWKIAPGRLRMTGGQTVSIEGLENTITDVLVIVRAVDGSEWQTLLTPANPQRTLQGPAAQRALFAFLSLGVLHILTGVDHLLFVLGLLLLVSDRGMLLKTVTAFTLAHSITLAMATLTFVQAPLTFVNAAIALSILFLGPEIVRRRRGETSLTIRHPWAVAFGFGLLHGLGFASGLTEIGLPRNEIAVALLLFNVGVEIGQLGFIAVILGLERALRVPAIRWPRPLTLVPAYLVGTLGALFALQQILLMF